MGREAEHRDRRARRNLLAEHAAEQSSPIEPAREHHGRAFTEQREIDRAEQAGAVLSFVMFARSSRPVEAWMFDRTSLVALGRSRRGDYETARPYPHVVIDGLLGEDRSRSLADAIPAVDHASWKRRDYPQQAKRLGQVQRTGFEDVAPELRWLLAQLTCMAFLDFVGALVGRDDLIADPHYTGAGPLVTLPGGHLALHADFNRDSARHLDRVVSTFYYLPREWDASWGGELELWDRERTRREIVIAPLRDRLVVLAHGEDHWHGHPTPVRCPDGHARVAIASYLYAARTQEGDDAGAHGAIWG